MSTNLLLEVRLEAAGATAEVTLARSSGRNEIDEAVVAAFTSVARFNPRTNGPGLEKSWRTS